MDATTIALAFTAYFIAAFVKGTTGLGFSSTCLPILVLGLGLKEALPLVLLPSVSSNLFVMATSGHFREMTIRFWPMYLASVPGIAAGLYLLVVIDARVATAALGLVLIAYCLFALGRPDWRLRPALERPLAAPVGFLTAVVNGLTGSQVMPVLPYLLALPLTPAQFIQTLNISFTFASAIMAIGLSKLGLLTGERAFVSVLGLLPVLAGVALGTRVRRLLPPEQFRKTVLGVLLLLAVLLLARLGF
ncbi:MAG: sulfite exporter TauE/SafE family protein [Pseudomonadota bacterium]|nr:sulfite exporter TauE/SafE family protein [Pseudomonadota bacterium]